MSNELDRGMRKDHDRDIQVLLTKLHEHKPKSKITRFLPIVIILVLVVLLASLLLQTSGLFILSQKISGLAAQEAQIPVSHVEGEYYGTVLERLSTNKQLYRPGETAVVQAEISSNEVTGANITYELYASDGKLLYQYTAEKKIGRTNTLQKKLLLTENYEEGEYVVEIQARFKHAGKKYVLPGKIKFWIEKEPWTERSDLTQGLLFLIVLLNMTLAINAFRND
ncbi:hypothetical protein ACFL0V_01685 [Nanoarchaeota archaeon]